MKFVIFLFIFTFIKNIISQECEITIYNHNPNKVKDFTLNCYKNGVYCNDVYNGCIKRKPLDIADNFLNSIEGLIGQVGKEEGEKCKKFNSECKNYLFSDLDEDLNKDEDAKCEKLYDDCGKEREDEEKIKYNIYKEKINTNKCYFDVKENEYNKIKMELNENKFECNEKITKYETCYEKCIKKDGIILTGTTLGYGFGVNKKLLKETECDAYCNLTPRFKKITGSTFL